jgi:hypothetical protein
MVYDRRSGSRTMWDVRLSIGLDEEHPYGYPTHSLELSFEVTG